MVKYICTVCGEELIGVYRDNTPLAVPEAGISLFGPFWKHKISKKHLCQYDNIPALELVHIIIGQLAIEVLDENDSPMEIEIVEVE